MPTNKERAEIGETIINHAKDLFGDPYAEMDTVITDILANLMHACNQGDQMPPFDDCLRIASMHHDAEISPGDDAGPSYPAQMTPDPECASNFEKASEKDDRGPSEF